MRGVALAIGALELLACHGVALDTPDLPPASPQASAEPAPLAALAGGAMVAARDGRPPPSPLRTDRPLSPDALAPPRVLGGDSGLPLREAPGLAVELVVHAIEPPPAYRAPEVSGAGLDGAKRRLEARLHAELAGPRARFVLEGAWPLPSGTELRARADHTGHIVVLPGAATYRVAAPGALRALLGERRLDVAPISPADVTDGGYGDARRLGLRVRRAEVTTRAGKGSFEIARVDGAGESGVLLCRALLDLLNAPPMTPLCAPDDVPLHAELRWSPRGGLTIDAVSLTRRPDLTPSQLPVPPPGVAWASDPLPGPLFNVLLLQPELAAFRSAEIDVPPPAVALPADVVGGLVLANQTDQLRFAWIDGLPVAYLAPGVRMRLAGLRRGRYVLAWRTGLGESFEPPQTISVPGACALDRSGAWHTGMRDAGAGF